jgi:hypothetical protein
VTPEHRKKQFSGHVYVLKCVFVCAWMCVCVCVHCLNVGLCANLLDMCVRV